MKLVKFLGICIVFVTILEIQPQAQGRNRVTNSKASEAISCPNEGGRRIWIRVKGEEEFGAILLQIDNEYINYCLGRRERVERMSEVQALYFDAKPIVITVPPRSETISPVKNMEPATPSKPSGDYPIKAKIKSPLRLRHQTLSGAVKLRVELKADNKVGNVTVVESAGATLDELAKAAAKNFEFVPEIRGGSFVTSEEEVILIFFALKPDGSTTTSNSKPGSASKKIELPEPIWPKAYETVARGTTQLSWKPIAGAVAYKLRIMYSPDGGNRWERYRDKSISGQTPTYELPFLGNGAVKWMVEVEREDGTETEGWWAHFAYAKK